MTPFGHKLRAMRAAKKCQLKDLAKALKVSSAYLSALEHGHRGKPTPGLVQQVAAYFNLAWEQVDELKALAELSAVWWVLWSEWEFLSMKLSDTRVT